MQIEFKSIFDTHNVRDIHRNLIYHHCYQLYKRRKETLNKNRFSCVVYVENIHWCFVSKNCFFNRMQLWIQSLMDKNCRKCTIIISYYFTSTYNTLYHMFFPRQYYRVETPAWYVCFLALNLMKCVSIEAQICAIYYLSIYRTSSFAMKKSLWKESVERSMRFQGRCFVYRLGYYHSVGQLWIQYHVNS